MVAEPKSAALPLGYSPSKIPAPTPTTPTPFPPSLPLSLRKSAHRMRSQNPRRPTLPTHPRHRPPNPLRLRLAPGARKNTRPPARHSRDIFRPRRLFQIPRAFRNPRTQTTRRRRQIIPTRKRNYRRFQPACQPRPLNPRIISAINLRRPRRNPRMRQRNPTPFPLRIIRRRNLLPDPRNPCRAKAGKKKRNVRPQLRPQLRQPRARKPQIPQTIQPQQNRRRVRTRPAQAAANRNPLRHRNVRPRMRRPRLRPQRQSGADAQIIRHPRMRPRPPNLPVAARRNFHRVAKLHKRRVRLQQMHSVVAPPDDSQAPINFRRRGKFKSHSPPSSFAAAACFKLTDAVPPGNFASIRIGFPPSSRAANSISHPC